MEDKIRVLQVVPNMDAGGLESFIMNMYRNIDREKIQFDFLIHYTKKSHFDEEIERLGGKIYRLSFREDNNLIKYIYDLIKFFKEHSEYRIVHGHMLSTAVFYLGIAKIYNVPVRIIHSHNTSTEKKIKGIIKYFMIKLSKKFSNVWLACSEAAGKFVYGNKSFKIINNAIDIRKFIYNNNTRKKIREELNIEDKFVIGHIGRFNSQKNHKFLLDIFNEISKKKENAVLLLIGKGELEKDIKKKIDKLGLNNRVMLLGVRSDVDVLYQAFDVFLLPSLFEGLPVVGIEAQAAGIQTIFSNTITKEVKISELAHFIDLNDTEEKWAEYILSLERYEHIDTSKDIEKYGYNMNKEAKRIMKFYINTLKENEFIIKKGL